MSMQDPIADMLTRIRNAQKNGSVNVTMPASTLKRAISDVLKKEGFILNYTETTDSAKKQLVIDLKYHDGKPVIDVIKRISRPGLRKYSSAVEMPWVKDGLGIAIVSTPKGLMTAAKARKQSLGGEILCYVE